MQIITTPLALLQWRDSLSTGDAMEISFVPFLGGLHKGHLALVKAAKKTSKIVVTSLFLNSLQFQSATDLDEYPMDLQRDIEALRNEGGVQVVFIPKKEDVYPLKDDCFPPRMDFLGIEEVDGEGSMRPTFFRGVGTIVTKLLMWYRPRFFFLGQKDFQQTVVLRRLCDEYFLNTKVIVHPVVREDDGVAYASRNDHLSKEERASLAPVLIRVLRAVESAFSLGERRREKLIEAGEEMLRRCEGWIGGVEERGQPLLIVCVDEPLGETASLNVEGAEKESLGGENKTASCKSADLAMASDARKRFKLDYLSVCYWSTGRPVGEILPSPGRYCVATSLKVKENCRLVDSIVLCDFNEEEEEEQGEVEKEAQKDEKKPDKTSKKLDKVDEKENFSPPSRLSTTSNEDYRAELKEKLHSSPNSSLTKIPASDSYTDLISDKAPSDLPESTIVAEKLRIKSSSSYFFTFSPYLMHLEAYSMYIRRPRVSEIPLLFRLESNCFAADEASSLDTITMRLKRAKDYFWMLSFVDCDSPMKDSKISPKLQSFQLPLRRGNKSVCVNGLGDQGDAREDQTTPAIRTVFEHQKLLFPPPNREYLVGMINATLCYESSWSGSYHDTLKTHEQDGDMLMIHSVAINEEYRRKRLATSFLKEYLDVIAAQPGNVKKVALISRTNNMGLYEACGFKAERLMEGACGTGVWMFMTREI